MRREYVGNWVGGDYCLPHCGRRLRSLLRFRSRRAVASSPRGRLLRLAVAGPCVTKCALTWRCSAACEGKRAPQCGRMHLYGLCPLCVTTWRSSQDMEQEALPTTLQPAHWHTKVSPPDCVSTWTCRRCSSRSAGLTSAPQVFHWHATAVSSAPAAEAGDGSELVVPLLDDGATVVAEVVVVVPPKETAPDDDDDNDVWPSLAASLLLLLMLLLLLLLLLLPLSLLPIRELGSSGCGG